MALVRTLSTRPIYDLFSTMIFGEYAQLAEVGDIRERLLE
jgi:hypothetical protein